MGLVYKKSTEKAARSYERSRGMEPNPGVSTLTVVNPGKRRVRNNPFQWIQGKGQRHRHLSPAYQTVSGASKWKGRSKASRAHLYPVDEHGTIVSRPVSKRLLTTNSRKRRTGMAYNIGALRRAMRSNMSAADRAAVKRAAHAIDAGGAPRRRRKSSKRRSAGHGMAHASAAQRRAMGQGLRARAVRGVGPRTSPSKRRRRKASVVAIAGKGGVAVSGRGRRRRKSSSRKSARRSSRKSAPKRRRSKSRARRSARRSSKRSSKRRSSKRRSSKRRSSKRKTRRGGKRRARATRRGGKRRSRRTGYRYGSRRIKLTGREYIDKYLSKGLMPTVARVRRTSASRSGRSSILTYGIGGGIGRLSKRKTSRRARGKRSYAVGAGYGGRRKRRMAANGRRRSRRSRRNSRRRRSRRNTTYYANANRRRSRRSRKNGRRRSRRRMTRNMLAASKVRWHGRGSHRAGRAAGRLYQMVEFGSRSKSRKGRRMSGYPVLVPAHVSERAYVRKYRFGGAAKDAHSRARSGGYRERKRYPKRRITKNRRRTSMRKNRYVVTNRRRSRRNSRRRRSRRNVMYATANVRRRRRRSRRNVRYATANRRSRRNSRRSRRNSRRRSRRNILQAAANGRRRSRRRRSRRNVRYALIRNSRRSRRNRRSRRSRRNSRGRRSRRNVRQAAANGRRRRLRRNMFFGADIMNDVLVPVAAGTGGFVAARVISNGLANIESIRNILDAGKPAAEATNTKIAANLLGILATLGLGTQVQLIKRHQGALITGMGLALTDRLLSKVTGDAAAYLSGVGEYVSSPMGGFGEYVNQPLGLGAYVSDPSMGEYVNQPLGETLYAAAGLGDVLYAAAGTGGYHEGIDPANQGTVDGLMDVMEAAAGTGGLGEEADASLARMWGKRQIGFESTETPVDVARVATRTLPFTREVPESLVTPEGRGYAGGLFARNLFSGMMGG